MRKAALTARSGSWSPAASFRAVPGGRGRICPSASAAAATDARLRGRDRLREQPDHGTTHLGQRLGDLIDPAILLAEAREEPGGGFRADLAEQERGVSRDAGRASPSTATRDPGPVAGATPAFPGAS